MAEEEKKEEGAGEEGAEASPPPPPAPPAGNNKLIFIMLGLNVLFMAGIGFMVFKIFNKPTRNIEDVAESAAATGDHAKEGEKAAGDGHGGAAPAKDEVDLFIKESFTVNLADSDGSHYAKVDVEIESSDAFAKDQINKLKPKIRDFIIQILSSKTYAQLDSSDGRDFLREEIRNKINGYLTRGEVKNVYFTQFIVQ